jgi:hypothetical protein
MAIAVVLAIGAGFTAPRPLPSPRLARWLRPWMGLVGTAYRALRRLSLSLLRWL